MSRNNLIRFTRGSHVFMRFSPFLSPRYFNALGEVYFFSRAEYNIQKEVRSFTFFSIPSRRFSPRRSFYRAFCETKYPDALVRAAIARKRGRTRERGLDRQLAHGRRGPQSCIARHRKVFRCWSRRDSRTAHRLHICYRLFALERLILPATKSFF